MNSLHDAKMGEVFWTTDGEERVRVEHRVGLTDMYECTVFDSEDGRRMLTCRYFDNGIPTRGDVINKRLKFPVDEVAEPDTLNTLGVHGVAATSGHCESNGGLRGHSVGDVFPYIPFFKGSEIEEDPWAVTQWVRTPNGDELGPFDSIIDMCAAIEFHALAMKATFTGYHHVIFWNAGNYESYMDAFLHGAIYTTNETVDVLGDGTTTNGIYEVLDIIRTLHECVGSNDIVAGVLSDEGEFFTLEQLTDYIELNKGN